MANQIELGQHKLDLLDQFARAWRLSELHSLDEGRFELVAQDVGGLDLENVISERNQVGDCIVLHVSSGLQEGVNLPLLVVARIQLLVLGAR